MDRIPATADTAAACPFMHAAAARLAPDDVLVLEMPKRMVLQYLTSDDGARQLVLFYGGQEISFDEPHLFTFGETLATQSRFAAADAMRWGEGLAWSEVSACLETLLDAGILIRAEEAAQLAAPAADRSRPSPLAPAEAQAPASWSDLDAITRRLAGRAVEQGWLELVIPVFRIAHMALDADDRQVGEANVFPRALRLDRPTEWMACTYAGTRYLDPQADERHRAEEHARPLDGDDDGACRHPRGLSRALSGPQRTALDRRHRTPCHAGAGAPHLSAGEAATPVQRSRCTRRCPRSSASPTVCASSCT